MFALAWLLACASETPGWSVQHLSVVPDDAGLTGTQTWEFFSTDWSGADDADAFLCAVAHEVTATVVAVPDGCDHCTVAYALTATPMDSTCGDTLTGDPVYRESLAVFAIGDAPPALADVDRHPGAGLGWYMSMDGGATVREYGHAYDAGLDHGGTVEDAAWTVGETYTLWPAFAWELPA